MYIGEDIIALIIYALALFTIWKVAWLLVDQHSEIQRYKKRAEDLEELFADIYDEKQTLQAILQQRRGKYD